KAMNLAFCGWLYRRRRRERIWVMFHEVAYALAFGQPLRHNVLAVVTRVMAALVARSAERCFASIPAWISLLRKVRGRPDGIDWLPVPSNLPTAADPDAVADVRHRYAPRADQLLVGHFGTYGELILPLLEQALAPVLEADARRVGLLIGRRGQATRDRLASEFPGLRDRLFATGELLPEQIAAHLAACDVVLQPYPDGISSRRTSAMAGLALGKPIVTTRGPLTETLWEREEIVALASAGGTAEIAATCERLLACPATRREIGDRGRRAYAKWFGIKQVVAALRR